MKKLLIQDRDYEQALDEMGFCVAPLFTREQIGKIKLLYQQFFEGAAVQGLIASHSKTGAELSLKVSNSIKDIVMPALENWFLDFNFFLGGFMVKAANTVSEFPLHQDWNIVDETKYTSYQIWIPLELSSPYNGGIFVLPGSHRFFENNRSGSYGMPRVATDEELRELVVDMIIPTGSALIYHNSLFHASYPNRTSTDRISAIINVYQKDALLEYTHRNDAQKRTEKYSINTTTFLSYLNTLEKGRVPVEFTECANGPLDQFDNARVKSADLKAGYFKQFSKAEISIEPLQLHILNDNSLEEKMKHKGYAVIDFADGNLVEELKGIYLKNFSKRYTETGRFTTMENTIPELKRYYHEVIIEKSRKSLEKYFKNYHIPIASYFVKYANSKGDLEWHQDSSLLLNAHLEPHYALWCPLVSVDETNGALCVIEHSHKLNNEIITHDLPWPYRPLSNLFEKNKKVINLSPGQAVLFDIRLIHHATPNTTNEDRICFSFRITHQKSKYFNILCEKPGEKVISVFEETPDFYLRDEWNFGTIPKPTTKIGEIENVHSDLEMNHILKSLQKRNKEFV